MDQCFHFLFILLQGTQGWIWSGIFPNLLSLHIQIPCVRISSRGLAPLTEVWFVEPELSPLHFGRHSNVDCGPHFRSFSVLLQLWWVALEHPSVREREHLDIGQTRVDVWVCVDMCLQSLCVCVPVCPCVSVCVCMHVRIYMFASMHWCEDQRSTSVVGFYQFSPYF